MFDRLFKRSAVKKITLLSERISQLSENEQYDEAIVLATERCNLEQKIGSVNSTGYANSLYELAVLCYQTHNYEKASSLLGRALETHRAATAEHELTHHLRDIAFLYYLLGDYQAAESLYREVYDRNNDLEDLIKLGEFYHAIGNYQGAALSLREAGDICRSWNSFGSKDADTFMSLASLYLAMGSYEEGLQLVLEARSVLQELHKPRPRFVLPHPVMVNRPPVGTDPKYAQCLTLLGSFYESLDNYEAAEPLYYEARNIYRETVGEEHPSYATVQNHIAQLQIHKGYYEEAETIFRKACEIDRKTVGEQHPRYAYSLKYLGNYYYDVGNYEEAETIFRKACEIDRKTVGEQHPRYASDLELLASLFAATDRVAEAFDLMMQAASIQDHVIGQVFSIGSESQRMAYLEKIQGFVDALLSLVSQHYVQSTSAAGAAMDFVLRRKAIGAEALAVQRDAMLGGKYPALQESIEKLRILTNQIARESLAGQIILVSRSAFDAALRLSNAGHGTKKADDYRQHLIKLHSQKSDLEEELAHQIPEMKLARQLDAADHRAVADALPEGSALIEFVRFEVFDFKAVRPRGESRRKESRYLAFILCAHASHNVAIIEIKEADAIDKMVTEFRAGITRNGQARGDYKSKEGEVIAGAAPAGTDLRKAVFDPFISHFAGATRLFIAPDGELTRLPFEALHTDDGRRLIDAYHISYLSVGRDALRFKYEVEREPTTSLVIADPDFNFGSLTRTPGPALPVSRQSRDIARTIQEILPLPGAEEEGRRIASLLNVQPWLQQEALEGPLKATASPRIFHVATHGFFLESQRRAPRADIKKSGFADLMLDRIATSGMENPLLRSGILLAGVNTWLKGRTPPRDAEDGILTAMDVSGLDLLATELAVLSACDTGLGDMQTGEGVLGLRRAFMLAGAKTLVMSLWAVDDKATKELMVDFYTRILAGEGRADALRNAQLAIKAKYPDPYYWGAFICQGDPSPLIGMQQS